MLSDHVYEGGTVVKLFIFKEQITLMNSLIILLFKLIFPYIVLLVFLLTFSMSKEIVGGIQH